MKKSDTFKKLLLILGILFLLSGFCIIAFSAIRITGHSISEDDSSTANGFLGIFLFFTGIFLIKRSTRKGQSAIEFLMTYGWAILAAVIALGVLAYFGVFSGAFNPQTTVMLSPPLYIDAAAIEKIVNSGGQVIGYRIGVEVSKNDGRSGDILSILAKSNDGETCLFEPPGGISISANQKQAIYLVCNGLLGKTFNGDITVSYTNSGSNLPQSSSGTITGSVSERTCQDLTCGSSSFSSQIIELTAKRCFQMNEGSGENDFNSECDSFYPGSCDASNNYLSCDDDYKEDATYSSNLYGGLKGEYFDDSITNCIGIKSVSLCSNLFVSENSVDSCLLDFSVDGVTYDSAGSSCPTTSDSGVSCVSIAPFQGWSCENFFDSSGTFVRSQVFSYMTTDQDKLYVDVLNLRVEYYYS